MTTKTGSGNCGVVAREDERETRGAREKRRERQERRERQRAPPRDDPGARDLHELDDEQADERPEAEDLPGEGGVLRRSRFLALAHPLLGELQGRREKGGDVARERDDEPPGGLAGALSFRLEDDARVAPCLAGLAVRRDDVPARRVLAEGPEGRSRPSAREAVSSGDPPFSASGKVRRNATTLPVRASTAAVIPCSSSARTYRTFQTGPGRIRVAHRVRSGMPSALEEPPLRRRPRRRRESGPSPSPTRPRARAAPWRA